jgi:hypothetical protein
LVLWKHKQDWRALSQTNQNEEREPKPIKLGEKRDYPNKYQWNSEDYREYLKNLYSYKLENLKDYINQQKWNQDDINNIKNL